MHIERWLPEIVHRQPSPLVVRYRSDGVVCSGQLLDERMRESLHASRLEWRRADDGSWLVTLSWKTLVLGVLRRKVDELVEVRLVSGRADQEVAVTCRPHRTHDAHAAGMSGVIVLACIAWLVGGWSSTGIPSGVVTLLVGAMLADYARRMALTVLQRRLQRLAEDLGIALWPRGPR